MKSEEKVEKKSLRPFKDLTVDLQNEETRQLHESNEIAEANYKKEKKKEEYILTCPFFKTSCAHGQRQTDRQTETEK